MAGKLSGSAIQTGTITSTQLSTELGPVSSELQLVGSGISLNVSNNAVFSGNVGIGTASPSGKFHTQATNSGIYFDLSSAYAPKIIASGALSDLQLEAVGNGGNIISKINGAASYFMWFNGATETMRLNGSGNLGIGTTSPSEKLHIGSGQSNYIRIHNASSGDVASGISITRGDNLGLQIYDNPTDDTSTINAANNINIRTGTTSFRIFVNGAGKVGIGTTSFNTNGGRLQVLDGISFPATQSALSDPNTLDDYEEGTWTPILEIGGSSAGITYSSRSGQYVKIGKNVFINIHIFLTSKGAGSGVVGISGFPFSVASGVDFFIPLPPRGSINTGGSPVSMYLNGVLYKCNLSGGSNSPVNDGEIGNGTEFNFNYWYQTSN